MKISHTLYHNGIAYGIPEGTKVPEKPIEPSVDNYQGRNSGEDWIYACNKYKSAMVRYNAAIQALLSVAIQWEDQEAMRELLPDNAFDRPHRIDTTKPRDGIYQHLCILIDPVRQYRNKTVGKWYDGDPSIKLPDYEYREVLRLIPQPNSEQNLDPKFSSVKARNKVGLDEKKEPETKEPPIYYRGKFLNEMDYRGVSEEEPTQEELWKEVWAIFGKDHNEEDGDYKELMKLFHIQKLKP